MIVHLGVDWVIGVLTGCAVTLSPFIGAWIVRRAREGGGSKNPDGAPRPAPGALAPGDPAHAR